MSENQEFWYDMCLAILGAVAVVVFIASGMIGG